MQPNQMQNQPYQGQPAQNPAIAQQATGQGSAEQQVILTAKNLVLQHGQSPYQLSLELHKLKAAYLAQRFNISTQSAEK